jgi:hypothetical protein
MAAIVVGASTVAAALGFGLWLRTRTYRRGIDALTWIGLEAQREWREIVGRERRPCNKAQAYTWIRTHPVTERNWCLHSVFRLWVGDLAGGRSVLDRVVVQTPLDRLEVACLRAIADLLETGTCDIAEVEMLASQLPSVDHHAGVYHLAEVRSRFALELGDDPWLPWIDAAAQLGSLPAAARLWRGWLRSCRPLVVLGLLTLTLVRLAAAPAG